MEHPSIIRGKRNVPGGSALPWGRLIDGSVLTAALSDPAPAQTKAIVRDSAANGVMDVEQCTVARLMFGGTDTANETINFQVILWNEGVNSTNKEAWIGRVIAKGTAVLGDDVYASTGIGLGAAANFFADTIIDSVGVCRVYSPADETRAVLEVPILGAQRIEVQTDLGTAASADVFVQLGEPNLDAVGYDGLVEPMYKIVDGTTADVNLADPTPLATLAEVVATTAVARGTRRVKGQPVARIMFGGTDAADEAILYQVILWHRATTLAGGFTYIPHLIAAGTATLGDDVYATTGIGAATNFWADTITETMVRGAHAYSPADETRAVLTVPLLGAEFVTVEVDRNTDAATSDAFIQLGDRGSLSASANLGNHGLVNTAEVEINPATEDKQDDIIVPLGNRDYVLSASYTATITATSIIPTAFTATLPTGLVRIVLVPRGDVYYKIGGSATTSTSLIGQGSYLNLPVTKTLADTIQVYAAGAGAAADLLVCTPR